MSSYSKGRRFEYRVRYHLEKRGFRVFRSAGSHSIADLIALKGGEVWLVQCKATEKGYMTPLVRSNFIEVAKELGVLPMLAYKSKRKIVLSEVGREDTVDAN